MIAGRCPAKIWNKTNQSIIKSSLKGTNHSPKYDEFFIIVTQSETLLWVECLFEKWKEIYNHVHKILRLFDVLPDFLFTTNETKCDYLWLTLQKAKQLKLTLDLNKERSGNLSALHMG